MSSRHARRRTAPRPIAFIVIALVLLVIFLAAFTRDKPTEEPEPPIAAPEPIETALEAQRVYTDSPIVTPEPPEETIEAAPEPVSRYEEIEITEEDTYLLACLVYHEARGEPFEGQVAVVEVVFNRCLSDAFPDTIEEVVFQKYGDVWQFSPAPYIWTAEPGEQQYEAVETALSETEYNVTPETVYFSTAPYNDKISAIIGNHYFCEI